MAGVYSTRRKALIALEADEETILGNCRRVSTTPFRRASSPAPAPCQEVVLTGDAIDITRFPIPQYSPKDGGRYITPGIVVSKDPETGVPDIGHYRFLILGKDTLSYDAQPFHRFGKNIAKCQRMGIMPRAAVVIGVDPVLAYTCQMQVPDTTNDWHIAGGIRGKPVESGEMQDHRRRSAGQRRGGDRVRDRSRISWSPKGRSASTPDTTHLRSRRRLRGFSRSLTAESRSFRVCSPASRSRKTTSLSRSRSRLRSSTRLKRQFPTVERVSVRASAGVSFYVVISMRPRFAGEARQVILSAMSSNIRPKWVVVVDPDIDVHSSTEVEWAMAFRVLPQRDVFVARPIAVGTRRSRHHHDVGGW